MSQVGVGLIAASPLMAIIAVPSSPWAPACWIQYPPLPSTAPPPRSNPAPVLALARKRLTPHRSATRRSLTPSAPASPSRRAARSSPLLPRSRNPGSAI